MTTDRFWKFFWMGSGGMTVVGLVIAISLFLFYTQRSNLLAAVDVAYEPGKDPFLSSFVAGTLTLPSGYLYQNSLPLHFKSWTWEAAADWRSTETVYEGSASLKAIFNTAGATVGMNGPTIDVKGMKSISVAVRTDTAVGDVFLTLYDKNGNALPMQSLGWYASSSSLTPGMWERVTIPLENFGGSALLAISGFSVTSKNSGVAYIDAVKLSEAPASHPVWVAPPQPVGQAFNPFATSTPVSLPYTFSAAPQALPRWYTYFGKFAPGPNGEIQVGPSAAATTTGSMTIFRNGRAWSDYHIETVINWGQAQVFSLLARFVNDGDFVSCAFSRYGETVQLYQMIKGSSTFISQTPPLAVKDFEPWINVKMGMEVSGNRVACFIDGQEVLHGTLPSMAPQGSVGFETWDPNPAAAPHTLHSFVVTPLPSE